MKTYKIFFLSFLVLICTIQITYCQYPEDQLKINEDLFCSMITNNVFIITHYFPPPFGCNCMLVILPDNQAVLIDTPNETSGTKSLVKWIYDKYGDIRLTVINTGYHNDNLGGNEYLLSQNIDIYGADLTVQLVKEKGLELKEYILNQYLSLENKKYYDSYKILNFKPPNKTYHIHEGLILKLGDEIFEVYYPGESHTKDNVVVYLHENKILFGGCMIRDLRSKGLGNTMDANMNEWPISVKKVKEKFKDCRIVIPGHGNWGDSSLIDHTIELFK